VLLCNENFSGYATKENERLEEVAQYEDPFPLNLVKMIEPKEARFMRYA
jgi:hypothetical protein